MIHLTTKKLEAYSVLKLSAIIVGNLILLILLLASKNSVLAVTCTAKEQTLSATSLTNSELSTWTIAVTLSEDAPTFTIEYRIPEDARLQKGTTAVAWSGDTPCCYEKTIVPGMFGGGAIYLDFTQGPKNLTTGSTIILTITGIKNPSQGLPTVSGINFYSSGPNEPAEGSCFVGTITASSPSPIPTAIPPLPTITPVPPTSPPLPTNPPPTPKGAATPSITSALVVPEPSAVAESPENTSQEVVNSQPQRTPAQSAPKKSAPSTQTSSYPLKSEKEKNQLLPTATPLIDLALFEKLGQQPKEKVGGLNDQSKKILAVFLGEVTSLFLLMLILILKGLVF